MGTIALRSRTQAVEGELCALGVSPEAAASLAADLAIRYPLVRRGGLRALSLRLERKGLVPTAAEAAAAVLLALEFCEAGQPFEAILVQLRQQGVERSTALAAALDAVRIQRTLTRRVPARDRARSPVPLMLMIGAAALGLLAAFAYLA